MSQPARILIVDDEATIRLTLARCCSAPATMSRRRRAAKKRWRCWSGRRFDLLLVDLKMPGMDGMQVVAAARQRQPDLAIIVLTGHGSLDTAIEGLHQGVFDYLLKTTEPAQVIERVKAGLAARAQQQRQQHAAGCGRLGGAGAARRTRRPRLRSSQPVSGERMLTIGALQLDTWRQEATLAGRTLPLTPTEFRVLLCLAEHAGAMLSYTQLVRCAQGYDADELEAGELIKPHIHHLRQKLEPDPDRAALYSERARQRLSALAGWRIIILFVLFGVLFFALAGRKITHHKRSVPDVLHDQRDLLRPGLAGLVHAAAAEALQVERDVHIAQLFQPRDDPLALLQHDRQILGQHLQASDRVVVAHAELAQAQAAHEALGLVQHAQLGGGHLLAVGDPRGEAGERGLVPVRQAQPLRQRADLGLAQAGVDQRAAHLEIGRRAMAWPVRSNIVGHCAVDDRMEAVLAGQRLQLGEQHFLAVVAAIGRVDRVGLGRDSSSV